ncbi:MAG: hypothetical protein H6716_14940 [Polyangiaceae bacterium]|nr:hypothetical protein [Polyangiaceae bacterium]
MLVLLGPPFEGRNDQYAELAELSGLVVYDLKTKLKPDAWGVVKALAEVEQARLLHQRLAAAGYRVALVDPAVGHEPDRKIVTLRSLAFEEQGLGLQLQARSMTIPWGAVLVLVQGQVSVGADPARSSSSSLRAINPSAAELESFRESLSPGQIDAYLALDIHFITVPWVARVDARSFDFGGFVGTSTLQKLEACAAHLVERAHVRLDHGSRTSSVNAFTDHASRARVMTPHPSYASPASRRMGEEQTPRFDAYSRLVAEAERQTRTVTSA